jgi:hypothetical protein
MELVVAAQTETGELASVWARATHRKARQRRWNGKDRTTRATSSFLQQVTSTWRSCSSPCVRCRQFSPSTDAVLSYLAAISRVSIVTVFADSSVLPVTFTV